MADESRWGDDQNRDRGDRERRDQRRERRAEDWRDEAPRRYGAGDYEGQRYPEGRFGEEPRGGAWPPYEERRDRPDFSSERSGTLGWSDNDRRSYAHRREDEMRDERARDFAGWDAPFGGRPVHGREGEPGWDRPRDESRSFLERTRDELASLFGVGRRDDERPASYRPERSVEGEFRGHGPRGYRRSDERISDDVHDRLTEDPWLDASDVDVQVQAGEVTLSGRVRTRADKRRAEDLVEQVMGVTHVQNNLRADNGPTRYEDPPIS